MQDQWLPDFLDDPSFKQWALGTDPRAVRKWEQWLQANPDRAEDAYQAAELVRALEEGERDSSWNPRREAAHWQRIQQTLATQKAEEAAEQAKANRRVRQRRLWGSYGAVAATIALLISVGFYWLGGQGRDFIVLAAEPGQFAQVFELPDGSRVTLNQAARLRYTSPARDQAWEREVWLEGEAFFEVESTADRARFEVHTNAMKITVLGTRFNVRNQGGLEDVVLAEGKVHLSLTDAATDTMTLRPGERATLAQTQLQRDTVNVSAYTSWREGYLLLDDLSLAEVITRIEKTYDWQIRLEDSSLLGHTLQGRLPVDDPAMIEVFFSRMLGIEWEQRGQEVFLRAK